MRGARRGRRGRLLLVLAVVAGAVGAAAFLARIGWIAVQLDFRPPRAVPPPPREPELAAMRAVDVQRPGEPPLRADYLAPRNGKVIILLHGTGADRSQLRPEGRMVARHGYGLLALDWPGHGESGGTVRWDEPERRAATRAVDWVYAELGPGARVAFLAFSMGTLIATQVAAADPRVRALVLTGAFGDADEHIRHQFTRWGRLSQWAASVGVRAAGLRSEVQRPRDVIGRVSPRPVLLVSGTTDSAVPVAMTEELFAAARPPKDLWIVPGADHGRYADVAPEEYERRLVAFFDGGL